jgi:hypothetical protein
MDHGIRSGTPDANAGIVLGNLELVPLRAPGFVHDRANA